MNEAEVNKQIQQMVHFIRQEAEEKANEIAVSTEEEFNVDKLLLVEAEKKKIRADYDRKERLVTLRKKIEQSTQLNAQRLRYLRAQDDLLRRMRDAAERQLATISHQQGPYAKFLEALIIQVSVCCDCESLPCKFGAARMTCTSCKPWFNRRVKFMPTRPMWQCPKSAWTTRPSSPVPLNRECLAPPVWAVWCWRPRMATLCWTTRLMLACRLCSNNSSPRSGSACLVCARMVLLLLNCLDPSELPLPNSWAFHTSHIIAILVWQSACYLKKAFAFVNFVAFQCMHNFF